LWVLAAGLDIATVVCDSQVDFTHRLVGAMDESESDLGLREI